MNKQQLIDNMKIELDYLVKEYKAYERANDVERANEVRDTFRITAKAFNRLITDSFKRSTRFDLFTSSIINYAVIRGCEMEVTN